MNVRKQVDRLYKVGSNTSLNEVMHITFQANIGHLNFGVLLYCLLTGTHFSEF